MRQNPSSGIVDASLLSSIANLELIARKAVEGAVSGLHHSHIKGRNVEFSEHRPYNPGDELRHIDWRAYAKTDRYHVKQFEEDTNLRTTILVDVSGSMRFADSTVSKADYARRLAAAFSHLLLNQGDSVGLMLFDRQPLEFIPPRQRSDQWGAILETLGRAPVSREVSDVGAVLSSLGEFIKRRGLVIIISDLIDRPERVLHNLSLLQKQQHEIVVFHILTPEEIELPYYGMVEFLAMEGEEDGLLTSPRRLRNNYQNKIAQFLEAYRNGCLELGADYQLAQTGRPLETVLREYLQRRLKS